MRAHCALAAIILTFTGCASNEPHEPKAREVAVSDREKLDIYEAVVRYRLRRVPLARGSRLYLYINWGAPPGLAKRFPEYTPIIKSGSQGNSPPRDRWYSLILGVVTADTAHLILFEEGIGL